MSKQSTLLEEEIREEYYHWLIDPLEFEDSGYYDLAHRLHKIPFRVTLAQDLNRVGDGYALRNRFLYNTVYTDFDYPADPCSVLEMLVALAVRIDDILIEIEGEEAFGKWFIMLLDNLNLYPNSVSDEEFDDILRVFMDRTYEYDGSGGLFPLSFPAEDQRIVEIWYQMSAYLEENDL